MRRAPLTRVRRLPSELAMVLTFSLQNHPALVAMRNGHRNADLASELIKLFISLFVCEKDRLEPPIATFLKAEAVLRACIHDSVADDARRSRRSLRGIEAALCALRTTSNFHPDFQARQYRER